MVEICEEFLGKYSSSQAEMSCETLPPNPHHFLNGCGPNNSAIDEYKLNQIRTYYPDGKRKRAACLCFRNEARNEVLLVSSRTSPGRWVIPGGGLEPNETPAVAAVRELEEEAGVSSRLIDFLGNFEDATNKHRTSVYASVVIEEFDSWEDRERIGRSRRWFSVEEASRRLIEYKPYQDQYLQVAMMSR
ncbi:diphosphoinositol polyphosphate phosphohydrolase 1-like [Diadema antillarum]|uniref:diphosphoinositol polyphosphate phosphohydrolase 1-like n=1 Tax=Diadema antillarum TaxID=105358 RepID=UPI003A8A882B